MRKDVMAQLGALAAKQAGQQKQANMMMRGLGQLAGMGRNAASTVGARAATVPGRAATAATNVGAATRSRAGNWMDQFRQGYQRQRPGAAPAAPTPPPVPGGPTPLPTRASVGGQPTPGGYGRPVARGVGAAGIAGTGAAYMGADTDHIGGAEDRVGQMERMRAAQQQRIDEARSGTGGWFSSSSGADQAARVKKLEEEMASGNFGGGLFGGDNYAALKQKTQGQMDVLANNGQRHGGLANRLFGYRDQGDVDAAMGRFDDDAMKKRLAALGISGPRGRSKTTPGVPLFGTAATNFDDYRTTYRNPYAGRDWSSLLQINPTAG